MFDVYPQRKRIVLNVSVILLMGLVFGCIEALIVVRTLPVPSQLGLATTFAQSPDRVARVTIENHLFQPTVIELKEGEATAIFITNRDSYDHSFDIDAWDVHVKVPPYKTAVTVVKPPSAGQVEFACDVPGHRLMGMVGTLIVK